MGWGLNPALYFLTIKHIIMADNTKLENKAVVTTEENKAVAKIVNVQYIKESNGIEVGFKRTMERADAEYMVSKSIVKIIK